MMRLLVISGLVLANAVGTFVGLLVSSYLGGFAFENLKADVLKCVVLAVIVVLLALGLVALFQNVGDVRPAYALAVVPVVWFVVIKLLWLDLERMELTLAGVASLGTTIIALMIALECL